jgi:uncharacterized membrane protein YfcA
MDFNSEIIVIAFVFLFAAFIHGSIGFGFPIVATPFLALYTDIQTAIILTLIPSLLVNLVSIASEGHLLIAIRRFLPLALLAMAGSALGTQILIHTNSDIFKGLLSIAIIIYLLADKIKPQLSWIRARPQLAQLTFGLSAGVLGGLTNVMAPVLIIYSLESEHAKSDIIQASNFCFLLGKIIQIYLFSINGKMTLNAVSTSTAMLIVVSFALYAGIALKKKINTSVYKKVLRALLLTLAVILLVQIAT